MAGELLEILYQRDMPVAGRIAIVQDAAVRDREDTIATIFQFLDAPARGEADLDWDPAVENRYLKIALIGQLSALNERSRQAEIIEHVRQASGHASSPTLEMQAAAIAIAQIGAPTVLQQLIELGTEPGPRVAYNAIQTLEMLGLTQPATHAPLNNFAGPALPAEVEVEVNDLADYLRRLQAASNNTVQFSPATAGWLQAEGSNYIIGDGDAETIEPDDVLDNELRLYGLTYAFAGQSIVIETMAEAATRWQQWWQNLADRDDMRLIMARELLRQVAEARALADAEAAEMAASDADDSEDNEPEEDDSDLEIGTDP